MDAEYCEVEVELDVEIEAEKSELDENEDSDTSGICVQVEISELAKLAQTIEVISFVNFFVMIFLEKPPSENSDGDFFTFVYSPNVNPYIDS